MVEALDLVLTMPLRKEHRRKFYGPSWLRFRLELIEERGPYCSKCGRFHDMVNGAHPDHNPANRKSVVLLCPSCHARHDAKHRIAIMRRNRSKNSGQLWLLPEIEWAPFAAIDIPGRIYDRIAQLPLFEQY